MAAGERRIEAKLTSRPDGEAASANIIKRIAELGDWRGKTLAHVRQLIHDVDPDIEEANHSRRGGDQRRSARPTGSQEEVKPALTGLDRVDGSRCEAAALGVAAASDLVRHDAR